MPTFSLTDIVFILVTLALIGLEWSYRAKRDGKKEATGAMLFAGSVIGIGLTAEHFIKGSGPLAAIIYLMVLFILIFTKRLLIKKTV